MRTNILKVLAFILLLIFLFYINLWVFRSDYPSGWFFTFLGSVITLILFPYKTFFKTKNKI